MSATPDAGKNFGPYKFVGSDADSSDTTYANDTWTFSNLNSDRDGPATSGENMDYAPYVATDFIVTRNGLVCLEGTGNDYVFTSGSGNPFSGKITFQYEVFDDDQIEIDLRSMV